MPRQFTSILFLLFSLCLWGGERSDSLSIIGVVGGVTQQKGPYAALITPSGAQQTLIGGPFEGKEEGKILAVGLNASRIGVIGGIQNTNQPYAALFGPDGKTAPLIGAAFLQGEEGAISSVAINPSGEGIIGGVKGGNTPYAALFSSSGETRCLKGAHVPARGAPGGIACVAINPLKFGIIGGKQNVDRPYVALVAPDGTTSALQGPALPSREAKGEIRSVALNPSGAGLIGGIENGDRPYATFFKSDGTAMYLKRAGAPDRGVSGSIESVALNRFAVGLIGGEQDKGLYAALVRSDGVATPLGKEGMASTRGRIQSVGINDSGWSIIGGIQEGNRPYAALFGPDGALIPLKGEGAPKQGCRGEISSVSIHDCGMALIGGAQEDCGGYLAVVAPNGTTTQLHSDFFSKKPNKGAIQAIQLSESGSGVVGGKTQDVPFAALIDRGGTLTLLEGDLLPRGEGGRSEVSCVAINCSGSGILGGSTDWGFGKGFAALIDPNGRATLLKGDALPKGVSSIRSVGISHLGWGLIGGREKGDAMYGALVDREGRVMALKGDKAPRGSGAILSIAMSDSVGLIGGQSHNGEALYVALVDREGNAMALKGEDAPEGRGTILSTAMNASGYGIIGGQRGTKAYAALIDPNGTATVLNGDPLFSEEYGWVSAVAINDSKSALIGGRADSQKEAVAALIGPDGTFKRVALDDFKKEDYDVGLVAINRLGSGIIGCGRSRRMVLAALVSHQGEVTFLKGDGVPQGEVKIHAVAIDDSGVAFVVGSHINRDHLYGAVVAPNGQTTPFWGGPMFEMGKIHAAHFANRPPPFDAMRPKTFGVGLALADPLFVLSKGLFKAHLNRRCSSEREAISRAKGADVARAIWPPKKRGNERVIWAAPFVFHVRHKGEEGGGILKNRGIGGIFGVDHSGFGGAVAYAYQNAHAAADGRQAKTHQELAAAYGSWNWKRVCVEGAFWAGFFQMQSRRLTLGFIPSKALVRGRLFSPQLKIETGFGKKRRWIRPFAELHWAHFWQGAVKERGKSGLNLEIDQRHFSVLRSEFGLQFVQKKRGKGGILTLRQGISSINKRGFSGKGAKARYVKGASPFPITLCSKRVESLCGLFFSGAFSFENGARPLVFFGYRGEFGAKTMGHSLTFECRKQF